MRFRILNKIHAKLYGYFWLPCSVCKQYFGGHEWKANIAGNSGTIWTGNTGVGICPDCTKAGKGNCFDIPAHLATVTKIIKEIL